jgi:hypothetical protein
MKNYIFLLFFSILLLSGCSSSSSGNESIYNAKVEILDNGVVVEEFDINENYDGVTRNLSSVENGTIEFKYITSSCFETGDIHYFAVFTRKIGCFTQIGKAYVNGVSTDTLKVDVNDFKYYVDDMNSGVMFMKDYQYLSNQRINILVDSIIVDTIKTDDFGRFETDLESGVYDIFAFLGLEQQFDLQDGFGEYKLNYEIQMDKPNIYLYPIKEMSIDVNIKFPQGGGVVNSIPSFPDTWQNINVKPNGKINDKYDYLFYETNGTPLPNLDKGWIVERENLESFFVKNLNETGFNDEEIDDFIEWWIPILNKANNYAIFPLYNDKLEDIVQIEFSEQPDNIIRLIYVIKECDNVKLELEEPTLPDFKNEGFVVREWGVIPADLHNHVSATY